MFVDAVGGQWLSYGKEDRASPTPSLAGKLIRLIRLDAVWRGAWSCGLTTEVLKTVLGAPSHRAVSQGSPKVGRRKGSLGRLVTQYISFQKNFLGPRYGLRWVFW